MFQDGSGGGPTVWPPTRGTPGRRARDRHAVSTHLRKVASTLNAPVRPEAVECGKHPRSRSVSTTAAYNTCYSNLAAGLLTSAEPVVALNPEKVHPARWKPTRERTVSWTDHHVQAAPTCWAEFPGPTSRIHPFTSLRFHVLLNSLFKVLFNFPSRYLSAIGLVPVFSLRWSLPPTLGCIPKQPDS